MGSPVENMMVIRLKSGRQKKVHEKAEINQMQPTKATVWPQCGKRNRVIAKNRKKKSNRGSIHMQGKK